MFQPCIIVSIFPSPDNPLSDSFSEEKSEQSSHAILPINIDTSLSLSGVHTNQITPLIR